MVLISPNAFLTLRPLSSKWANLNLLHFKGLQVKQGFIWPFFNQNQNTPMISFVNFAVFLSLISVLQLNILKMQSFPLSILVKH